MWAGRYNKSPKINSSDIGLSKLNRVVEHYSKKGAIQENLTVRIHDSTSKIIENNCGVTVMIKAPHNCVQFREVRYFGTSMKSLNSWVNSSTKIKLEKSFMIL